MIIDKNFFLHETKQKSAAFKSNSDFSDMSKECSLRDGSISVVADGELDGVVSGCLGRECGLHSGVSVQGDGGGLPSNYQGGACRLAGSKSCPLQYQGATSYKRHHRKR